MIKFFRKIRQRLLAENKVTRYLLYAIGEIVLVVIGILIALQINNWNENRKNNIDEKRYINDLIQDLKNDSIMLADINRFMSVKAGSKLRIDPILDGQIESIDSLEFHFFQQWQVNIRFIPSDITFEELKNSGTLNLIRDVVLRREIVSLYHSYSNEQIAEDRFSQQNSKMVDIAGRHFRNLFGPTREEISNALKDNVFVNGIKVNFALARQEAIIEIQEKCLELIQKLEEYKSKINN